MSVIVANGLINGVSGVSVGGTGTGLKAFPSIPGPSIGVASTNPMILAVPGGSSMNGQRLNAFASGNFAVGAGGACPTFLVGLYPVTYVGTVPTIGATAIVSATTTAQTNLNQAYPWSISVDLVGDTLSGLVQQTGGTLALDGTITSVTGRTVTGLSSINYNNPAPFGLAVQVSWSVSETGNTSTMYQFCIAQV